MLKRVIWSCIAIALISWFVQSNIENKRIQEEEKQQAEAIRDAANALGRAHGVTSDWVNTLSGYKFKSILSVELERVWINNGPILFWGSLEDISTLDENHYEVVFKRSRSASRASRFRTELRLSLRAGKSLIDSFMQSNPDFPEHYRFNNGVAVVARIDEIYSNHVADPECGITDIKTGGGELLDLIYTGDINP